MQQAWRSQGEENASGLCPSSVVLTSCLAAIKLGGAGNDF
jgi:hypothetical protein